MEKNKIFLLAIIVGTVIVGSTAQCSRATDCITDFSVDDCDVEDNFYPTENSYIGGCCPGCSKFISMTDICGVNTKCPPGAKCNEDARRCEIDKTSCYHTLHLPKDQQPIYPPTCNVDGTYAAVQCKGDELVGRCFCSDEIGNRIFGISWAPDAHNMTCDCSRMRSKLERSGRTDVTLHCSANGNYEPLQCDSEMCWCVDPTTGNPTSMIVPDDLISQLECFNAEKFGAQYLRLCESKAYAIAVFKNTLAHHGTTQVTMETVKCDYDGTYGIYQIDKGIAYCSWRDGSRIGSWQTEAGAILAKVNCNCARDTKYFEEAGKTMSLTCSGEGNYAPRQQIDGQYYCVDSDGFPLTDLQDLGVEIDCTVYYL